MNTETERKPEAFGRKRVNSFVFALKGLWHAFRTETHMKLHGLAAVVVIAYGLWDNLSTLEWFMVGLAIALVFITELINTALEKLVDLVHPEQAPAAGQVKDIASGAVLVAACFALIVACWVFL